MTIRPVVTGIGIVAPNGIGTAAYWDAILASRSGIRRLTRVDADRYPVQFGGEIDGFVAEDHVPGRIVVQTDRWTHFGLAATAMALADAGTDPAAFDEYDMAVVTASSSGGTEFGQREIERLWNTGPRAVGAYQSIAWFYAATTGQVSILHGMRGPCRVIATEQAGGLDAVAEARRVIGRGTPMVVAGGTDASLCPYGLVAQTANGQLSRAGAYVPFDRRARGYLPGEGGAMMIIQDPGQAHGPGYGVIAGYAATFDPPPCSGRPRNLRRCVELALDDAGIGPDDVDAVFADAHGTVDADRAEIEALSEVFGPSGVPVTAPKTMTGRLYAGGAALDLATALLALRHQVIPPTVGIRHPAYHDRLDLVGSPRKTALDTALVLARGYGGFNAATVVATS
ncbi:act minimal PKS chain-length factor (CLF/KS beta) [Kibdelosporangium banguiense]|uniref:Act minimal PKS chain-length factor (CLF/KS beta) n=1 Tax=Kibdelosporangium banguiense TaxID=1365924 RepID=A0ABS4TFE9_9PSEU|nr:ketosynthase chain-length factor [Kibdelosporangium banguiense]MBP2323142.1 act minimal PKS chain-length factor (CLF/KS beta) [Kibdelosporangium banguiense]